MQLLYFLLPLLVHASPLAKRLDSCGPSVQDQPDSPPDTCSTPVTGPTSDPATYAVTVDRNVDIAYGSGTPTQVGVPRDWTSSCGPSIQNLCNAIQSHPLGKWTWDHTSPTCLIGVYLPDLPGSAPVPSAGNCADLILNPMATIMDQAIQQSNGQAPNRGRINLKDFPHGAIPATTQTDNNGNSVNNPALPPSNGVAVNAGYPSWFIQAGLGPTEVVPVSAS